MNWITRNLHSLDQNSSVSNSISQEELSEFITKEAKHEVVVMKGCDNKTGRKT